MRKLMIALLVLTLALGACSTARQKLSPQANVNAKTANVYYAQQNVDKAQSYYEMVLEEHPDHAISLRRMGDIYLHKGETNKEKSVEYNKEAFQYYKKALDIYADYENVTDQERLDIRSMNRNLEGAWVRIYRAGDALLNEGETRQAMEIFELAHELNPERFEPMIRLKDIYQKEFEDNTRAEEILLALINQDPDNLDYNFETGAFYYNIKDYAKATIYFEKARELAPANLNNLMNLSISYYELERYGDALTIIQKAMELGPPDAVTLETAAEIADKSGEHLLKAEYLKELVELNDDNEIYLALVSTLYQLEQYEEMVDFALQWYHHDKTSRDAVNFIILGAAQAGNDTLRETYTKILGSM
ncbi:MAG: tetratricopeptide repeat protein [Candidatus Cloacimonetes bacterium]|jgi:tetratricopeptide (TPR) repeat protein|nr:tetratricopeptide repeat protein [Candidatus Cloacimonadota bacterium]